MMELSSDKLKKYLETVIDLEGQILVGQQAIESIEKKKKWAISDQKRLLPSGKKLEKPQKREFKEFYGEEIDGTPCIPRPKITSTGLGSTILTSVIVFVVASVIFALCAVLFAAMMGADIFGSVKWAVIIAAIFTLLISIILVKEDKKHAAEYEHWKVTDEEYQKKYEKEKAKRLKAIEDEYKNETALYNRLAKEAEENQNKKTEQHNLVIKSIEDAASAEIERINSAIYSTKAALRQVYEKDIIYPKYRNFIAVCSLYEYLASGRCSCLEGHEGAYNIYESELRQDLILIKLDVVISQLEDIKKNQFTLYQKMCEINSAVLSISYQMGELLKKTDTIADNTNKIANNTAVIAQNTKVTALCTQMIAKNTEALKYISLVN